MGIKLSFPEKVFLFFLIISSILVVGCNNATLISAKSLPDPLEYQQKGIDTASNRWISWNVVFKDHVNYSSRVTAVQQIEADIINNLRSISGYERDSVRFQVFYCPCDTLLYNLGGTVIDGSGEAVSNPPQPPPKPPGGSGDIVLYASLNNQMQREDSSYYRQLPKVEFKSTTNIKLSSKVIAVLDTGIDPTIPDLTQYIEQPSPTCPDVNFVTGGTHAFDDHPQKHGTAVAALILQGARMSDPPRLMILKVLDKQKHGTTFSVSCGLSYASKNGASMVNASLGYYASTSDIDSVLRHYVKICNDKKIPIFAAAGNAPGFHNESTLCNQSNGVNFLAGSPAQKDPFTGNTVSAIRLFYPACFSTTFEYVIAVTGLKAGNSPCFYQNYSNTYVTLGVVNNSGCCKYAAPFVNHGYEGTSFATPIACGSAMSFMISNTSSQVSDFLNSTSRNANSVVTVNGRYITFSDNPPGW